MRTFPEADSRLQFAMYYATQEHVIKNHQLHGILPYTHHLQQVDNIICAWIDEQENRSAPDSVRRTNLRLAAWCHDLVEDCPDVKLKNIAELFGEPVELLVDAVTDVAGPLHRTTRKTLTYLKIRAAGPDAVLLKLADRTANVRAGGGMFAVYQKEHDAFHDALWRPNEWQDQWNSLYDILRGR
jgi:(p)ppGpp synthase/HD superfamily hydrolase